jgi:hypothetical protein
MKRPILQMIVVVLVAVLVGFPLIRGSGLLKAGTAGFVPSEITPSLVLMGAGAKWAAQNGNSTLFVDWEDNYLAHGNTDGVNWGPWPAETDMKNWTDSTAYALTQAGLNVTLAGDIPSDLTGFNLIVIAAYWAVTPSNLAPIRDFIANGGGVVILSGVPEMFRTYCKDWWTYWRQTDPLSVNESQILGCDGDYVNTGGYANVTVDNPFGTNLLSGDTLFESTGISNAGIADPQNNGAQVIAQWNPGLYGMPTDLTVAFAYTFQYGSGRVYYQASFTPMDPPNLIQGDINRDGKANLQDLVLLAKAYNSRPGELKWNPAADINFDGVINLSDLVILANHYNQHYP